MTREAPKKRHVVARVVSASAVATTGIAIVSVEPAAADVCTTRVGWRVCQSTNWTENYFASANIDHMSYSTLELAAQADYKAITRIESDNHADTIHYSSIHNGYN